MLWRSLEELADREGFRLWLREQHPQLADALDRDRREFLKILGASMALAGFAACSHPPQNQIVPYVHSPFGQVDGLPRFFATALPRNGYAHGVLVENHMGRPTKIEGNPQHPASLGATDIFAQAAVLQLWDPDRSQAVMHRNDVASWNAFAAELPAHSARFERTQGAGLHVLTETITSPTLSAQLDALRHKFPRARWHVCQPAGNEYARSGAELAFGVPLSTRLRLDRARVILSLDADFLSDPAAGVRYAHDFAMGRSPGITGDAMSRLYVLESTPSITGGMADHRLPLDSVQLGIFVQHLAKRLGIPGFASAEVDGQNAQWLQALAGDLQANRGTGLVVVGAAQPPWMHALGHALNASLGNAGTTVVYSEPVEKLPDEGGSLADLVKAIRAGSVDTLWVLDANPVYDAPADLQFAAAIRQVPHVLHLGLYRDETAALAEWHLPQAHSLETWSDMRAFDGTATIMQPLIAPLYEGRSAHEILAALLGDPIREGRALVRRQWQAQLADDTAWSAALQAGVIPNTTLAALAAPVRSDAFTHDLTLISPVARGLELLLRPDPTIGTGRWANSGWLQELPKPHTQLTWDNAALISPTLATQMSLRSGDVVELSLRGRNARVPVFVTPGQAPRSITLHLGYGRRRAGRIGDARGFDAYVLRTIDEPWGAGELQIRKTGSSYALASTQHHFNMEGRELLRVGTLGEYQHNARFATAAEPYESTPPSLYPELPSGQYAWGMCIDLNACIGCKACTVACQAENNIPVVGKEQVQRGREMHWIRVDSYYEGAAENPHTYSQPVPCMMCEHAPCEVVCPVDATLHDSEGLNVQVYNRCVGTRFCSNNCPYKVRRFNFLQYVDENTETLKAQRNPEVTVRRRGVMEKCTYCVQRIQSAHIEADKANRSIRDGEVVTACQAVCPTQAIHFGNLADPHSEIARAKASPRNYVMLGELNTRPRTSYLARLRNPNPALEEL